MSRQECSANFWASVVYGLVGKSSITTKGIKHHAAMRSVEYRRDEAGRCNIKRGDKGQSISHASAEILHTDVNKGHSDLPAMGVSGLLSSET